MNRVPEPGAPSIDRLQVLVQSRSINASKCLSKLPLLRPPSASPNSLYHGLQVNLQTPSIMACKGEQSRRPSAASNSLDHNLGVDL